MKSSVETAVAKCADIERKNYNVVEINLALYEFDQSLLGMT